MEKNRGLEPRIIIIGIYIDKQEKYTEYYFWVIIMIFTQMSVTEKGSKKNILCGVILTCLLVSFFICLSLKYTLLILSMNDDESCWGKDERGRIRQNYVVLFLDTVSLEVMAYGLVLRNFFSTLSSPFFFLLVNYHMRVLVLNFKYKIFYIEKLCFVKFIQ